MMAKQLILNNDIVVDKFQLLSGMNEICKHWILNKKKASDFERSVSN